MKLIFSAFLIAFVCANLIVKHFGAYGLWISSFTLIPFDFVARCIVHEKYRGWRLLYALLGLTIGAAVITVVINWDARRVASASVIAFTAAQIVASLFYQWRKKAGSSYFVKVNFSDLFAIVIDSVVFQSIAFAVITWQVTGGQVVIKFLGGLLWYAILFQTKLRKRLLPKKYVQTKLVFPDEVKALYTRIFTPLEEQLVEIELQKILKIPITDEITKQVTLKFRNKEQTNYDVYYGGKRLLTVKNTILFNKQNVKIKRV